MAKQKQEVAVLSEEQLAVLNENYPLSAEDNRQSYPRFGMLSKDLISEEGSGKNKKITILQASGTFYTERDLGEVNAEGKSVWTREYIDAETVPVIIAFHRYQLRKFDSSLNKFISSPIYDNPEQTIPLYLDKQIIKRGTEKMLQDCYPALTQKGKQTSDLKKNTILFVLYNGEMYQLNLGISSGWAFSTYKKGVNPSTVLTTLGSVEETFGTNTYRKMVFVKSRQITPEEFEMVNSTQTNLKEQVERDDSLYLQAGQADKDFDKLGSGKKEKDIPFD